MYRPAWRMSHTGVRSTVSPRAQRTRMSRSEEVAEDVAAVVAVSVEEWRVVGGRIDDDEVKADAADIRPIVAIDERTFMVLVMSYISICYSL